MAQRSAVWLTDVTAPYRACCRGLGLLLLLIGTGCATSGPSRHMLASIPPLSLQDEVLTVSDVALRVQTPDLLAVDEAMRQFVGTYTGGIASRRQRLRTLHSAVSGAATLGVEYDPFAEGTAQDAFHRQTANCLSYANLFVALAREAGLDARYQWVDVRPRRR